MNGESEGSGRPRGRATGGRGRRRRGKRGGGLAAKRIVARKGTGKRRSRQCCGESERAGGVGQAISFHCSVLGSSLCVVVRAKAERGQSEADERVCHPIPSAHVASGYSARLVACSRRWALSSCGASWTSLPSGCMHGWLQRVAQTPPPGFGGICRRAGSIRVGRCAAGPFRLAGWSTVMRGACHSLSGCPVCRLPVIT